MSAPVLEIERLEVTIRGPERATHPIRGVDLRVAEGEVVGVVGETGCGKTLTGLAALGLLPPRSEVRGSVRVGGRDVTAMDARELRALRGSEVAMVFQNPATAFDPVTTIGRQLVRVIRMREGVARKPAAAQATARLDAVGLPDPDRVMRSYPHELSGGMLQRAMLALALSARPRLVIADEATAALDVTVARRIRRLLLELQAEHGFGVLFVTHNLAEARDVCDRLVVLYAGTVAESGPTEAVFGAPSHPYTQALLRALPQVAAAGRRLESIPGSVPPGHAHVDGCLFANRCPHAFERCTRERPATRPVDGGGAHVAACHLVEEGR